MRLPLIAGNWKMNMTEAGGISLVRVLIPRVRALPGVEVLVCPPFTALSQLHKLLISSPIQLGAQNISEHEAGAYTGEISARMAAEFCSHVILGHSERRAYHAESDRSIHHKIQMARTAGLVPILCVGESLEERDAGQVSSVLSRQLRRALEGIPLSGPQELVIAYEPVWAIGTGRSADPEDISELVANVIRPSLAGLWGENISQGIRVLYGGSVNPGNAMSFFSQPEIDGALVGGASLEAEKFLSVIEKTQ
jgi:triosephosphate isomerase (TIM)